MVNSSWTRERIATLWGRPTHLVFPPCDVEDLAKGSVVRHGDTGLCVASVAQVRATRLLTASRASTWSLCDIM